MSELSFHPLADIFRSLPQWLLSLSDSPRADQIAGVPGRKTTEKKEGG